jgi:hypothetical protein
MTRRSDPSDTVITPPPAQPIANGEQSFALPDDEPRDLIAILTTPPSPDAPVSVRARSPRGRGRGRGTAMAPAGQDGHGPSDGAPDVFDIEQVEAEEADADGEDEEDIARGDALEDAIRPIVVIEGEGPARELYRIMRQLGELRACIEPLWVPSLASLESGPAALSAERRSRIIACWRQVTAKSRDEKWERQASVFPDAQVVTFARLSMELLWPLTGADPRRVPEPPVYKQSRYLYADRVAASLAELDLPDTALFERYMALSTLEMPDLGRWFDDTVSQWQQRERASDVPMVDDILADFQSTRLFHAPGAPAGKPLIGLLRKLIDTLASLSTSERAQITGQLGQIARGYLGQMAHQWPIHPLVADAYDLRWYDADMLYRVAYNKWTHRQYILNYIRWAPWST